MMKCKNEHCDEGKFKGVGCSEGFGDLNECPFWKETIGKLEEVEPTDTVATKPLEISRNALSWTGNSLGSTSIQIITERGTPFIVGVIGENNSGKTTFLRLFYLLLRNGQQMQEWSFSGSYTLIGWENVARSLEFDTNNKLAFPPHTSMTDGRNDGLLHLSMRTTHRFKDFIFTDTTGEWFKEWARNINSKDAQGAKWIHQNSDVFIFFVDCEALIERKWKAEKSISLLASRLKDDLDGRKVAILWSKADKFDGIPKAIVKKLERNLANYFENSKAFKISVEETEMQNVAIDIMDWLVEPEKITLQFISRTEYEDDFLFNYKKQFENE